MFKNLSFSLPENFWWLKTKKARLIIGLVLGLGVVCLGLFFWVKYIQQKQTQPLPRTIELPAAADPSNLASNQQEAVFAAVAEEYPNQVIPAETGSYPIIQQIIFTQDGEPVSPDQIPGGGDAQADPTEPEAPPADEGPVDYKKKCEEWSDQKGYTFYSTRAGAPKTSFENYAGCEKYAKERCSGRGERFKQGEYVNEDNIDCCLWDCQPLCTDTDGGKDYYKKGQIDHYRGSFNDYCQQPPTAPEGTLEEGFCLDKPDQMGNVHASVQYLCPHGCQNGVCLGEPEKPTCTDTDGGKDHYVKGTVTTSDGSSVEDICTGPGSLLERYCLADGRRGTDTIFCTCQDGACVKQAVTPTPTPTPGGGLTDPKYCGPGSQYGSLFCDDTDGGNDVGKKGIIHLFDGQGFSFDQDWCLDASRLYEHCCVPGGIEISWLYDCPLGCRNGACSSGGIPPAEEDKPAIAQEPEKEPAIAQQEPPVIVWQEQGPYLPKIYYRGFLAGGMEMTVLESKLQEIKRVVEKYYYAIAWLTGGASSRQEVYLYYDQGADYFGYLPQYNTLVLNSAEPEVVLPGLVVAWQGQHGQEMPETWQYAIAYSVAETAMRLKGEESGLADLLTKTKADFDSFNTPDYPILGARIFYGDDPQGAAATRVSLATTALLKAQAADPQFLTKLNQEFYKIPLDSKIWPDEKKVFEKISSATPKIENQIAKEWYQDQHVLHQTNPLGFLAKKVFGASKKQKLIIEEMGSYTQPAETPLTFKEETPATKPTAAPKETTACSQNWTEYYSDKFKFKIKYPPYWSQDPGRTSRTDSINSVALVSTTDYVDQTDPMAPISHFNVLASTTDLKESDYRYWLEEAVFSEVTYQNLPTEKYLRETQMPAGSYRIENYRFKKGDLYYWLSLGIYTTPDLKETNEQILNCFLESFEFLD